MTPAPPKLERSMHYFPNSFDSMNFIRHTADGWLQFGVFNNRTTRPTPNSIVDSLSKYSISFVFESDSSFEHFVKDHEGDPDAQTLQQVWNALHTVENQHQMTTICKIITELRSDLVDPSGLPSDADMDWVFNNRYLRLGSGYSVNITGLRAQKAVSKVVHFVRMGARNDLYLALLELSNGADVLDAHRGFGTHWRTPSRVRISVKNSGGSFEYPDADHASFLMRGIGMAGALTVYRSPEGECTFDKNGQIHPKLRKRRWAEAISFQDFPAKKAYAHMPDSNRVHDLVERILPFDVVSAR